MLIRITEGTVYTGKKDKPFAQEGETVKVRTDVARRLIKEGAAEEVLPGEE